MDEARSSLLDLESEARESSFLTHNDSHHEEHFMQSSNLTEQGFLEQCVTKSTYLVAAPPRMFAVIATEGRQVYALGRVDKRPARCVI